MRRHVDGRPISQTNKLRPIGSKHPAKSFSRDLRFHRKRNSIPILIEFSSSLSAEPWNNFFVKKCATHLIYNGVKWTSERERKYINERNRFLPLRSDWLARLRDRESGELRPWPALGKPMCLLPCRKLLSCQPHSGRGKKRRTANLLESV